MLLLDTNVLSAWMLPRLPPELLAWHRAHPGERRVTAAVCQAEILAGLRLLSPGRRRERLGAAARAFFTVDLAGRVLPFGAAEADAYAELYAGCRRAGRPLPMADLMIAATALVAGATVVTRNVAHFTACGVPVGDPWSEVR